MSCGFLGYVVNIPTDLCKEGIYGVPPVKELPDEGAGRTQAKAMTGVGVEENGPVVKLLPEYDYRAGQRFFTIFHATALPFFPR
jgi:hypothetical protein